MPAIDLLKRPDLNSAFPVSAGAASSLTPAGSATAGAQFGDVLSNSIDLTSSFGPAPGKTPAGIAQFGIAQFGSTPFGSTQFGNTQSGAGQSGNAQPGVSQSGNSSPASAQSVETSFSSSQTASASSSDSHASGADDAQKRQSQNADAGAAPPAGNTAATDQPLLLAASVSGANHATSRQSSPNNSADASTAKASKPEQDPATRAGAAPAQLVNNLLQADIANGNTPDASTNGATQTAQTQGGDHPDAPQALIAGLQQAVNQNDAQANRAPAGQPVSGSPPETPASDASRNAAATADNGPPPDAVQPASTSTAVTADAGNLVSLLQTSTTSSTAGAPGNSSGKNSTSPGAAGNVASAPPVVLPATTTADGSGNSQTSTQSNSFPGAPAAQQPAATAHVGKSFTENAAGQSAALLAAPFDALPATAQVSISVLPSTPAISATSVLDKSNPAQPPTANDAGLGAQNQGSQSPGYLLFGAAPPSLQLQVSNFPATQAASSGSLTSVVLDQAAYAVQYSHANGQQMQLHLNPPELGALQVDVSMRDGVLSARIEAQTSTAQQILTDNISQLKDSLTQQGVSFDRIDVHLAGSNTGSGGTGTADKSFAQQQDGGLPWNQQFVQPESDDSAPLAPVSVVRNVRIPLTSLDIMI
jgi:flagellar hook-length control protein FliK